VHSSYRTLSQVDGGPAAIIQALLNTLGPQGNLMLPTFNYLLDDSQPYFDPNETPGKTGIIPEIGRCWPSAVRSLSPTHSVAVIGPEAEWLTKDHLSVRSIGIGSPIDKLAKQGGKVLLLGVGNICNSCVHIGEEYAGIPKAPWQFGLPIVKIRMPDGTFIQHVMDTSSSCSTAFGAVELPLRMKGQIRDLRVGSSKWQLMLGQDVINAVLEIVTIKPDILLCSSPTCVPCQGVRSNMRAMKII